MLYGDRTFFSQGYRSQSDPARYGAIAHNRSCHSGQRLAVALDVQIHLRGRGREYVIGKFVVSTSHFAHIVAELLASVLSFKVSNAVTFSCRPSITEYRGIICCKNGYFLGNLLLRRNQLHSGDSVRLTFRCLKTNRNIAGLRHGNIAKFNKSRCYYTA